MAPLQCGPRAARARAREDIINNTPLPPGAGGRGSCRGWLGHGLPIEAEGACRAMGSEGAPRSHPDRPAPRRSTPMPRSRWRPEGRFSQRWRNPGTTGTNDLPSTRKKKATNGGPDRRLRHHWSSDRAPSTGKPYKHAAHGAHYPQTRPGRGRTRLIPTSHKRSPISYVLYPVNPRLRKRDMAHLAPAVWHQARAAIALGACPLGGPLPGGWRSGTTTPWTLRHLHVSRERHGSTTPSAAPVDRWRGR